LSLDIPLRSESVCSLRSESVCRFRMVIIRSRGAEPSRRCGRAAVHRAAVKLSSHGRLSPRIGRTPITICSSLVAIPRQERPVATLGRPAGAREHFRLRLCRPLLDRRSSGSRSASEPADRGRKPPRRQCEEHRAFGALAIVQRASSNWVTRCWAGSTDW
jgi:hypothetical protein